jgi:hypothetical protein
MKLKAAQHAPSFENLPRQIGDEGNWDFAPYISCGVIPHVPTHISRKELVQELLGSEDSPRLVPAARRETPDSLQKLESHWAPRLGSQAGDHPGEGTTRGQPRLMAVRRRKRGMTVPDEFLVSGDIFIF